MLTSEFYTQKVLTSTAVSAHGSRLRRFWPFQARGGVTVSRRSAAEACAAALLLRRLCNRDGERIACALFRATEQLVVRRGCVSGGCKAAGKRAGALAQQQKQQTTRTEANAQRNIAT